MTLGSTTYSGSTLVDEGYIAGCVTMLLENCHRWDGPPSRSTSVWSRAERIRQRKSLSTTEFILLYSMYEYYITGQLVLKTFSLQMSRRMGKPTICIGKNKGADQLHSNCEADQRLCLCYMVSAFPLLSKSKISSLIPSSVTEQPSLCRTWSETKIVGFLTHMLK